MFLCFPFHCEQLPLVVRRYDVIRCSAPMSLILFFPILIHPQSCKAVSAIFHESVLSVSVCYELTL